MAGPDGGWPGLHGDENTVDFSVSKMRAVAKEMRGVLTAMNGGGTTGPAYPGERVTTGALSSVNQHTRISHNEIGSWPAAATFAHAAGSTDPDPGGVISLEGNSRGFEIVYAKFVSTFEKVVQALEDHATEYEKTNIFNGG
ncbi:hypothetical protein ACFXJ8_00870 [Nonomuraea sp. NPDC059194]|uniref:hypothetical protein n=1 Tax=Nonomuraea sp. NPDC059194 TaxID=3346764 RepID=UPI003679B3CB